MKVSIGRSLVVTLGLGGVGVVCGGFLGGVATLLDLGKFINDADVAGFRGVAEGAMFGAIAGAVLAPVVGWIFLRRVALGRAIGETATGTLIGILAATLWPGRTIYVLGFVGFLLAAARLWFGTRRVVEHRAPAA